MAIIIGIEGISRSGKTMLSAYLKDHLPNAVILHQDNFIRPENKIPMINGRVDWEHPESIDWPRWGAAIERSADTHAYVILEGLFIYHDHSPRQRIDHKIILSIDQETFIERKKKDNRWGNEPEWYIRHIWDAYLKYRSTVLPGRSFSFHNLTAAAYSSILKQITGPSIKNL